MKKILLSLLFLLSASMLFAQHREQRELTSFDGIRFAGRGSLYISAGEQSRLELEASDPAALPRILTRVEGGTLHIEYMRDEDKILDVHPRISVYLTYEQLRSIRTEGIVNVYTEDAIRNGSFFFKAEGVGKNELLLEVENLEVEVSGTANVRLYGTTFREFLLLEGTGTLDAFELQASQASVEVNGTGSVFLNVSDKMIIDANGFGAQIRYRGNPEKKVINKSGWVTVKPELAK